ASRQNLATAYSTLGRWGEALPLFEATLRLQEAKLGPDHPSTLQTRSSLALAYRSAGRWGEALPLFEATLRLREAKLGPDPPDPLASRGDLAQAYLDVGRWADGETLLRGSIQRRRRGPADGPALAGDLALLGLALLEQSKWTAAERVLRECLEIRA